VAPLGVCKLSQMLAPWPFFLILGLNALIWFLLFICLYESMHFILTLALTGSWSSISEGIWISQPNSTRHFGNFRLRLHQ